ncbi:MAG: helix-turn-helix domain-containing protein [Candidatus Hydrogenedentes bacterium]|nr:helix-turn-helix domain-containing protein [Candidatus Hydrogenedentota bacterium]
MQEAHEKELLSVREVASMLDLCERSVYRMADAGKMPRPLKLGARSLWRRRELQDWVDAGCKPVRGAIR